MRRAASLASAVCITSTCSPSKQVNSTHIAGLLSDRDQAQPVRPSDELSRRFFSLLSIAHHHERVVAKNGAQFRRMMDDEWDAQTSKHACHPGEIFHFNADEYSIVLLFKMPL